MKEVVDSMLRLFEKLGWPGIVVALSLFLYQDALPTLKAQAARCEDHLIVLEDNMGVMEAKLESALVTIPYHIHPADD